MRKNTLPVRADVVFVTYHAYPVDTHSSQNPLDVGGRDVG